MVRLTSSAWSQNSAQHGNFHGGHDRLVVEHTSSMITVSESLCLKFPMILQEDDEDDTKPEVEDMHLLNRRE